MKLQLTWNADESDANLDTVGVTQGGLGPRTAQRRGLGSIAGWCLPTQGFTSV